MTVRLQIEKLIGTGRVLRRRAQIRSQILCAVNIHASVTRQGEHGFLLDQHYPKCLSLRTSACDILSVLVCILVSPFRCTAPRIAPYLGPVQSTPYIKIYLIACRRCGPFSHSNHSSWLIVVVGFRHAIMQISTAPLAIALAIYTPVACRQRRRHGQLYVRCLSS